MLKYLLVGLLLVGCSDPMSPKDGKLHQSWCLQNVPPQDIAIIQDAMSEWNSRTGKTTWHFNGNDCDGTIKRVQIIEPHSSWIGDTFARQVIEYEAHLEGIRLNHVILHELGHVAYLEHSDNPADIMYPTIPNEARDSLSEGDLNAFHSYWW